MKALFRKALFATILCLFTMAGIVQAQDSSGSTSTSPTLNNDKPWRIGYYEGGPYIDYQKNLIALVQGFMELGWIETAAILEQKSEDNSDLWKWLTANAKSRYIEFAPDGFYSAAWKDDARAQIQKTLTDRLNKKKDIDMMLALGTWAGQDLATNAHSVPTLIMSTSDPVKAGIIKSVENSGFDHIHARVDPYRYERQIRIFHDIISFSKIGVAYEDTETGHTYASLDNLKSIAAERGFDVVSCHTVDDTPDQKAAQESVEKCFKELVKTADAIYVTKQNGINEASLPKLIAIANEAKIPTFSQSGSKEVQAGVLMSISKASYVHLGRFLAETAAKIFNGAKPRQLPQIFEGPPKIAINLKTAEIIGYDPPVDVLSAADEIFQEIQLPK